MTAAAEDSVLTGLWFAGQKYFPAKTRTWTLKPDAPVFTALQSWLDDYFAGKKPPLNLPLKPQGTAFQLAVWEILLTIPYGQLTSYGEITQRVAIQQGAASMSAQAVGGAVGHNPISILIPCHRVVGASGSLTGYAGGLDKKRFLLELEGSLDANDLFGPAL
jgi:methylated-DNA-[protein]-cysteine S-methyltransferase